MAVKTSHATAVSVALFFAVLALNPSQFSMQDIRGLAHVAWLAQVTFTTVLSTLAFAALTRLVQRAERRSMVKANTEYWKMAVAYFLTFISLLLVSLYTLVYPPAQFAAGFTILFAVAYAADAFNTFMTRVPSRKFLEHIFVFVPVLWFVLMLFTNDVVKSFLYAPHILYLAYFTAAIWLVVFARRRGYILTSDYRMTTAQGVAVVFTSAILLVVSQTVLPQYYVSISFVRAVLLTVGAVLFYECVYELGKVVKSVT